MESQTSASQAVNAIKHVVPADVHIHGIYRHRNGHEYKVLAVARSVDDLSWWVIYEALYDNPTAKIWSRKLEEFLSEVMLDTGEKQPRFVYQRQG